MNINLDEKKIKNIVYLTRNGRPVNLVLKNGELVDVTDIPLKYSTDRERENTLIKDTLDASREKKWKEYGKLKKTLSDREMIEAVKNSEFMDELKKVKDFNFNKELKKAVSKEVPKEENVLVSKKLIELDKDGTLNKIAKEHNEEIGKKLNESRELHDTETQYDIDVCTKSMIEIEKKALDIIRNSEYDEKKGLLDELMMEYEKYNKIQNDLRDKLWETQK